MTAGISNDINLPQIALLRSCANLHPDEQWLQRIARAAAALDDWRGLAALAERHGLAPLLYRNLKLARVSPPEHYAFELRALTLRHRRANEIRASVLGQILDAFDHREIRTIALKGAALSRTIYPAPELRPMSDLDILVAAERADEAQAVLRELSFYAPPKHVGYMHDHHHLPSASRKEGGMIVNVEIHTDALSSDVPESIRLDNLTEPPRDFVVAGRRALALGHVDTLRHLSHHTFEPAAEIKLGSVVDLYGYAMVYRDEIDWAALAERYPRVPNTLRCLHYLVPLPDALRGVVAPPSNPPPPGVGRGFRPLSQILTTGAPWRRVVEELFNPPEWWLHAHYGIAPEIPLRRTRWLTHPTRLAYWLLRRQKASWRSRMANP